MIAIHVQKPDGQKTALSLNPGHITAGGGRADGVPLEGAGPALANLEVSSDDVIVVPMVESVRLADKALKRGQRRLLRPGERLLLEGFELWLEPPACPKAEGTAALARGVLAGVLGRASELPLPSLVWLNGRDAGRRHVILEDGEIVLGRGEEVTARVRDSQASRVHACLTLRDGVADIADRNSANGLFIDGDRIEGSRRLRGGETITIGETEIAFEASLAPPPEPAPQPTTESCSAEPVTPAAEPATAPAAEPESPALPAQAVPVAQPPAQLRPRLTALELTMMLAAVVAGAGGIVAVWLLVR